MYDSWIYIGGCGSAHSHGHINLFSTICNISCHHPIATHHRWQGWLSGLNFSHLIFIFPPEQLDSLRQILHLKGQLTCQSPNIEPLSKYPKVFFWSVAPWSQICQRWEHPAPTRFQAHSCCPGFPVKKFPKEINQHVYQKPSWDVKLWSSGNISWRLVRTCHPFEQKHSPCLYTALSTIIHSPWPCNRTKVAPTIPHRRWHNL